MALTMKGGVLAWCADNPDESPLRDKPSEAQSTLSRAPISLRDLPSGTVFEATTGWRGVKTAEEWAPDVYVCIVLGDGVRTHENGGLMVTEIPLPTATKGDER